MDHEGDSATNQSQSPWNDLKETGGTEDPWQDSNCPDHSTSEIGYDT